LFYHFIIWSKSYFYELFFHIWEEIVWECQIWRIGKMEEQFRNSNNFFAIAAQSDKLITWLSNKTKLPHATVYILIYDFFFKLPEFKIVFIIYRYYLLDFIQIYQTNFIFIAQSLSVIFYYFSIQEYMTTYNE